MNMPIQVKSYRNFQFIFVILIVLISIQFWSFHGIPSLVYQGIEIGILSCLVLIILHNHNLKYKELIFRNNILLFIFIPILSCFGALIFHDQSLELSLLALRTNFFWILYFVLHVFNISTKHLVRLMTVVGLIWILITIVQQFTYPFYLFYTRNEEEYSILRSGVYRFMINGHHYGLFIVIYYFYGYLTNKKLYNLLLVIIGLVGFYYFGTRQFAVAAVACLAIAVLMQRGSTRIYALGIVLLLTVVVVFLRETLFANYIEMTASQVDSDDDIRWLAAKFYLTEYWTHWSAFIIGNGIPHSLSKYGEEMNNIKQNWGYFRSDVGLIGAWNTFGIFYIINIIWVNIKGLKRKYYVEKTKSLRLVFYYCTLLLLISQYYDQGSAIPFFCIIFYLIEKERFQVLRKQNTGSSLITYKKL